jgi:photosystem II protein PsbQ
MAATVQSNQLEQPQLNESPNAGASPAYSSAQLKKLAKAGTEVNALRSRLEEFQPAIEKRNWAEVHKKIASLVPDLKSKMMSVTDQLSLNDRLLARALSTEVFIHLEQIDAADEVYDYQAAETNYLQALQDFDAFLSLIPAS